ncbi:MAG: endonuclease/exonuclease/phosphatase family protein [Actinoplanes sp.]
MMLTERPTKFRRFALSLGIFGVVVAGVAQFRPADAATGELSLMSWNVQGKNLSGSEATGSTDSVVTEIRATGADFVGLQEISGDQAKAIASELGWGTGRDHVLTKHEHGGIGFFREGIAMISKYPMTEMTNTGLEPRGRGRHLQHAKIVKDGRAYHVFNTHLGSDDWSDRLSSAHNPNVTDEAMRNEQARFVRDQITALKNQVDDPDAVFILTADTNSRAVSSRPAGWAYKSLTTVMSDTWLLQHPTATTPDPGSDECHDPSCGNTVSIRDGNPGDTLGPTIRIDYIMVDKGRESSVRSTSTPHPDEAERYKRYSDHFPVRAVIGPAPVVPPPAPNRPPQIGAFSPDGTVVPGTQPTLTASASAPDTDALTSTSSGEGYWLVDTNGDVFTYGDARYHGTLRDAGVNVKDVVGLVRTPDSGGYWIAGRDGGVYAFGNATFHGSMGGKPLNAPVVGMAATKDGGGYWLVAEDGGVFAFGNANFYGSMAGKALNGHIDGMSVRATAQGYWLNGCDGGVFAFGDAPFYGSNSTHMCRGS